VRRSRNAPIAQSNRPCQTIQADRGATSIVSQRCRQLNHPVVEPIDVRRFDHLAQTSCSRKTLRSPRPLAAAAERKST
jgi:hypothetical protein